MDFFSQLPTPGLWVVLAVMVPLVALAIGFLANALKSEQFVLFGSMIADRGKSPALYWTLLGDGLSSPGLACS
jgi:hypothetical protein